MATSAPGLTGDWPSVFLWCSCLNTRLWVDPLGLPNFHIPLRFWELRGILACFSCGGEMGLPWVLWYLDTSIVLHPRGSTTQASLSLTGYYLVPVLGQALRLQVRVHCLSINHLHPLALREGGSKCGAAGLGLTSCLLSQQFLSLACVHAHARALTTPLSWPASPPHRHSLLTLTWRYFFIYL